MHASLHMNSINLRAEKTSKEIFPRGKNSVNLRRNLIILDEIDGISSIGGDKVKSIS